MLMASKKYIRCVCVCVFLCFWLFSHGSLRMICVRFSHCAAVIGTIIQYSAPNVNDYHQIQGLFYVNSFYTGNVLVKFSLQFVHFFKSDLVALLKLNLIYYFDQSIGVKWKQNV